MDAQGNTEQKCLDLHTFLNPPYSYYYQLPNGQLVVLGSITNAVKLLMKYYGYCYKITPWDTAGTQLLNGTWTSLLGKFADGTADLGATYFVIDPQRAQVVDYLVVTTSSTTIIYKAPTIEPDLSGFVRPFTYVTWSSLALSVLAMALALWFISKGSSILEERRATSELTRAYGAVATCVRALLGQDLRRDPKTDHRIMVGSWLVASLIIGTMYKSNLMARLITPRIGRPFDSLEQLVETDIPFHMLKDTSLEVAAKSASPDTVLARAALKTDGFIEVPNMMKTMQDLARGDYALVISTESGRFVLHYYFQMKASCPYMLARDTFYPGLLVMIMKKGSPRNDRLRRGIVGLVESGILEKMVRDEMRHVKTCQLIKNSQGSQLRSLQFEDFAGVLLLYGGGLSLGIIAFIVELIVGRSNTMRTRISSSAILEH